MLLVKATKNTFDSKEDLKENGFVWDKENKIWTKKFESNEEYEAFMEHFMSVTYYGRKAVNKFHSKVVFEVEEEENNDESLEFKNVENFEENESQLNMEKETLIDFVKSNDFAYVYGAGIMYANDEESRKYVASVIEEDGKW